MVNELIKCNYGLEFGVWRGFDLKVETVVLWDCELRFHVYGDW